MLDLLLHPVFMLSVAAGVAGALMLVQARVQSRLLRSRIATGAGSVVMDPATGLFSPAAAWQCIRGEANRAARLERPLEVWLARATDAEALDEHGRALSFELPAGATGIRIDDTHVALVTCADAAAPRGGALDAFRWQHRSIADGEQTAAHAQAWISEVTAHG